MSETGIARPRDILDFWFSAGPEKWFSKDEAFDAEIRRRFYSAYEAGCEGRLDSWAGEAQGALALVILLDQFPRNLFRNDHRAFSQDEKALKIAQQAIERRFDVELPALARKWFYLPFMHSEELVMQERCVTYCETRIDDPHTLEYARIHLDIIERFGRFPHRNEVLGRRSTPEEQAFLDAGGFAG